MGKKARDFYITSDILLRSGIKCANSYLRSAITCSALMPLRTTFETSHLLRGKIIFIANFISCYFRVNISLEFTTYLFISSYCVPESALFVPQTQKFIIYITIRDYEENILHKP
jgi:hypothetical protein